MQEYRANAPCRQGLPVRISVSRELSSPRRGYESIDEKRRAYVEYLVGKPNSEPSARSGRRLPDDEADATAVAATGRHALRCELAKALRGRCQLPTSGEQNATLRGFVADTAGDAAVQADTPTAFYRRHGWHVGALRVPGDLIERARAAVERRDDEHVSRLHHDALARYLAPPARRHQYVALQHPEVLALARHPAIAGVAAELLEVEVVRLFNSALISKAPGDTARYRRVGWHCDQAYWPTCSSRRMITAWVPLQDSTASMGTLTILDGSHAWPKRGPLAEVYKSRTFVTDDHDAVQATVEELAGGARPIPLELECGQVSFHHPRTLHGSGENHTDQVRIAISLHLQDGGNRYRKVRSPTGTLVEYTHDALVRRGPRGEPDYTDPAICPVLWDGSRVRDGQP